MPFFSSFWIGGFESACHVNGAGRRLDMLAATQHDRQAAADYMRLRDLGMRTARDAARWHLIDTGSGYDFSSLAPMVDAAKQTHMQVIWTLCHYGWPDGLDLLGGDFVARFSQFCGAVAQYVGARTPPPRWYCPINEISFLAYAAGQVGRMLPYARRRGDDVKRQLVRAAMAGVEAIRAVDPTARIVTVDPIIHIVPLRGRSDLADAAASARARQFEAWDMLAGRTAPELGGHPKYLDVIGVNFYHANQWEHGRDRIRWEDNPRDKRWVPLSRLLAEVYCRYRRPLFIAETSHFGAGRAAWLHEIAHEAAVSIASGVPLGGICVYPVLDRPDWENTEKWDNCGLWDIQRGDDGTLKRILNQPYAAELRRSQALLKRSSG